MKITREQYEQIKGYLPVVRGNVKIDNRVLINAILYMTEKGCKWRALPIKVKALTNVEYYRIFTNNMLNYWYNKKYATKKGFMHKMEKTENHYRENASQRESRSVLASQNWQGVLGIIAILTLFIYLMAEIRNIRSELKQDMRDLRIELKQEIKETNLRIDKLDAKIDKITDLLMSKNRG